MAIIEVGMSIVALDPGGTTGMAIWDGIDKKLMWDQMPVTLVKRGTNTQRGRRNRGAHVSAAAAEHLWVMDQEMKLAEHVCDIMTALGPLGVLVIEDFILGWGGGKGNTTVNSQRAGLSPVRITSTIYAVATYRGLFNGDAWRKFRGMDMGGRDQRGVIVGKRWQGYGSKKGRFLSLGDGLRDRVGLVEAWALDGGEIQQADEGALWSGEGWALKIQGVSAAKTIMTDERMKAKGLWVSSKPHATDALRHLALMAREIGISLPTTAEAFEQNHRK